MLVAIFPVLIQTRVGSLQNCNHEHGITQPPSLAAVQGACMWYQYTMQLLELRPLASGPERTVRPALTHPHVLGT